MVQPGLCGCCEHARLVTSPRGTVFRLCERSRVDAAYARYPILPRLQCPGYVPSSTPSVTATAAVPALVIRPAVQADVATILSFIQQLAAYERLSHEVDATVAALDATLFGPRPAAEVLLASLDGRDVGFALFYPTYSTFLARPGIHLEDLFVVPEARGRGVGRALLVRLAELAVARDCGRLEWNVLAWNAPAITFYRRMGAFSLDDWQTFRLHREGLRTLATAPGTSPPPIP